MSLDREARLRLARALVRDPDQFARLMYLELLRRGLPFPERAAVLESIKLRVAAKKAVRTAIERAKRP